MVVFLIQEENMNKALYSRMNALEAVMVVEYYPHLRTLLSFLIPTSILIHLRDKLSGMHDDFQWKPTAPLGTVAFFAYNFEGVDTTEFTHVWHA